MADARIVLNLNADIQRCQTMTLFQHISWVFTFHCRIFASVFFPRQITLKQAFSGTKSAPLLGMSLFLRETSQASDMSVKLAPYLWSGCSNPGLKWVATSEKGCHSPTAPFDLPAVLHLSSNTFTLWTFVHHEGETICLSMWAIKPPDINMVQVWFV